MKHISKEKEQGNNFDDIGRFIIPEYDHQKPFSSFLPGIAGLEGVPLWAFYVNRAQAVCSFGVENKDHPILEFQPAHKAYRDTALNGFRTFINAEREGKNWHREMFSPWDEGDVQRKMFIGMNELELQEVNLNLGYQVSFLYFILPNLPIAGLLRRITIKNLRQSPLDIEVLDGLPRLIPFGVSDGELKQIGRTIEAWMQVDNLENKIPYYRLKASAVDTAEVQSIQAGNFALAFSESDLLPVVVDPSVIFGLDTGNEKAHLFYSKGLKNLLSQTQILEGRSICAFFGGDFTLGPGESQAVTSLYGYTRDLSLIEPTSTILTATGYVDQKLIEARGLTAELTQPVRTKSASAKFDGYCRQTFLDNLIRGGYPLVLNGQHVYHVYSRKHGDIERDYNYFVLPAEYYSQGNGNYRDINQNRRNDVFFVPKAGEFNIRLFMSLIQADGYNPLVISGMTYTIRPDQVKSLLEFAHHKEELQSLLTGQFTPGELLNAVKNAKLSIGVDDFFVQVFTRAESHIQAQHGEGFWIDHWTYNLDLIEAYLAVFPDKKTSLLFHSAPLPFYDNTHVVQPRKYRFVLSHGQPRQLNALVEDEQKTALIQSREDQPHWARSDHGKGDIFKLPLISKLILLALIKFMIRDPSGMGIQMEAGRPGWYDALNGLPGLFGSSMSETYELLRLVKFLLDEGRENLADAPLPKEARILLDAIQHLPGNQEEDSFALWEAQTNALEHYREATRLGFDGEKIRVDVGLIFMKMRDRLKKGIEKAHKPSGDLPPTYFIHEVTDYQLTDEHDAEGRPIIQVKGFQPKRLPDFLEGPVRLMKTINPEQAETLAQAVDQSSLFDRKLKMYKINASLEDQSYEIGRARAFTPGWLENESIWMHMSFKYLLELLRAGLYDGFFTALKNHLPAFMEPETYGRSILENSSFIVSSEHPDPSLHGNGFVARLSGSTAEFLSMWVHMTTGGQPFRVQDGQLTFNLNPVLPAWMFDESGCFTFRLLGSCDVTLHNPTNESTYTKGVAIGRMVCRSDTESVTVQGDVVQAPYAEKIREGDFEAIDVYFKMRDL